MQTLKHISRIKIYNKIITVSVFKDHFTYQNHAYANITYFQKYTSSMYSKKTPQNIEWK